MAVLADPPRVNIQHVRHRISRMWGVLSLPVIAALLLASGVAASASGSAPVVQAPDPPMLAIAAYNTPSDGREIQLVGLDGRRVRVDPHPPLPIDGAWSPDGARTAFSGGEG